MKLPEFLVGPVHVRTVLRTLAALAVMGAIGAVLVVGLGLYNVSAKTGHFPGVSWILHTTFRNSVHLRADASPPETLGDADMIALGAGHFDDACRMCHAAPGETRSATVRAMVPEPPPIAEAVKDWKPHELHWIVHKGIKMSGMPHWPATREDDVWPVVAFLLAADGMSAEDYARLTERPGGKYCAMCHGIDGVSDNRHVPRLDILSEQYIADSLRAYRDGQRDSGIMAQAVGHLSDSAVPGVAATFSDTTPRGQADPAGPQEERGRSLATATGPSDVPACRACHGPWPEPLNPAFPS
ncbi:c-type cytochrome, partial [Cribrihabitans sp. XS_ASV171]